MPTSLSTGMAYIRWQVARGIVHKDTLSGYLSVFNCANSDMTDRPDRPTHRSD